MKSFMGENYLIESKIGRKLYQKYAKNMPIFDYHCHLNAKDIYENKPFKSLTQVWLCDNGAGDHYKWRVLRTHGVNEEYITGNKSDYEKFFACSAAFLAVDSFVLSGGGRSRLESGSLARETAIQSYCIDFCQFLWYF